MLWLCAAQWNLTVQLSAFIKFMNEISAPSVYSTFIIYHCSCVRIISTFCPHSRKGKTGRGRCDCVHDVSGEVSVHVSSFGCIFVEGLLLNIKGTARLHPNSKLFKGRYIAVVHLLFSSIFQWTWKHRKVNRERYHSLPPRCPFFLSFSFSFTLNVSELVTYWVSIFISLVLW